MTLNLGEHTTTPLAAVGVSVDYAPFVNVNVSTGSNTIPLGNTLARKSASGNTVVRINVQGWQDNRIHFENIVLNHGARLLRYKPSDLTFHIVGDSLSAGQFLPQGVDQAWPFLAGEFMKAEHVVVAQPGATLTDMFSYGNAHGLAFQFFQTEDTGYYYTSDHNFTTAWDFKRDVPAADYLVIHLGTNDSGQSVPGADFVKNYLAFLENVRKVYKSQTILIFTPWGWPSVDGSISSIYPGLHQQVVNFRQSHGDRNIFLVDTTGWVQFADVFPDNQNPNVAGHAKIAGLFESWLHDFGVMPQRSWATSVSSH